MIVPPTIRALEGVRAGFALLYFKTWWICLLIGLITPPKFSVVLRLVRAITFDAFGTLNSA